MEVFKIKIILSTLNAKYIHSSPALRSLYVYSKEFIKNLQIKEYTINNTIDFILGDLYNTNAEIFCFSCYIWNVEMTLEIISSLKKVLPSSKIIIGGPEAYDIIENNKNIDITVLGEGEKTFLETLKHFINKEIELEQISGIVYRREAFSTEIFHTKPREPISLDEIPFLYNESSLLDLENKIIYYEASRGCPYNCGYCMSSIDKSVRFLSLNRVFSDLEFFLKNKVKQVKFVDRTFNCNKKFSIEIYKFLINNDNGFTNFHFEISGDLLDEEEFCILKDARKGLFQFEIGVQSTNLETLKAIDRKTDLEKLFNNVKIIKSFNNIHQHLDLIAGLPYENYDSFKKSFNDVMSYSPDVLQLGFLKVLKETQLRRDSSKYGIIYREKAPYEVLSTDAISFGEILFLKNIEEILEIFYNSQKFSNTTKFSLMNYNTPFDFFESLSNYWKEKDYYHLYQNKMDLYLNFLKFADKYHSELIEKFEDLVKFDILLRDNVRSLPERLTASFDEDEKNKIRSFFKDENNEAFENIKTLNQKERFRICKIEKFRYNVYDFSKNNKNLEKKDLYILFNYYEKNKFLGEALVYPIVDLV